MTSTIRAASALALALALCGTAWAQPAQPAQPARTAAAPAPLPAASAASAAQVRPHIVVIEDDGSRIEETRVGGTVKRVIVQSKIGNVRPYEIQVAPAGRDPSQERGNAGQRAWSLFNF